MYALVNFFQIKAKKVVLFIKIPKSFFWYHIGFSNYMLGDELVQRMN